MTHKSLPRTIISDNASTYLAAANELKELFTLFSDILSGKGVQWQFIPKRAPYGGFWKRLIGLTRIFPQEDIGTYLHNFTKPPNFDCGGRSNT